MQSKGVRNFKKDSKYVRGRERKTTNYTLFQMAPIILYELQLLNLFRIVSKNQVITTNYI